ATNGLLLTLVFLVLYVVIIQRRFRSHMKRLHSRQRETELKIFEQQRTLFKDEEIPDRVAVNAALERIVASEGQDTDAITKVLKFASRVQSNAGQWYERINRQSSGDSFRG